MTTFLTFTPHYCNLKYAEAVCDRIFYMKRFGIPKSIPIISNVGSGFINSLRIPKDDVYLCEGPSELYPFLRGKPTGSKIITFMKESTLFNFPNINNKKRQFIIKLLSMSDAFITDTKYYMKLTKKYFDVPVFVHPPFCAQPFLHVKPDIYSKKLLFIAEKDKKKGLKQLGDAFKILNEDKEWELFVVGRSGRLIREKIPGVHVEGYVKNLETYMEKCSIYVHPAQFDVFGVSVLEAMSAGVIPVVSKNAGVSEYISKQFPNLIINSIEPEVIANKIMEVHEYDRNKKLGISKRCKKFVRNGFMEKQNVGQFKKIFSEIDKL